VHNRIPAWVGADRRDSFVSHECWMAAPVGTVFDHLVALDDWRRWQRRVDRVEVAGEQSVRGPHDTAHLDGIVGEFVRPNRFGRAAVTEGLDFHQLIDEPDGGTRTIFHEAARGPSALLRTPDRAELTLGWVLAPAEGMIYPWRQQRRSWDWSSPSCS
jgi:hypothetical protein